MKTTSVPRIDLQRETAIRTENAILLRKIATISTGPAHSPKLHPDTSWPLSLNQSARRREKLRIAAENKLMTERIIAEKSVLSTKRLEQDYKRIQSYKELHLTTPIRTKEAAQRSKRGKSQRELSSKRTEIEEIKGN